MKEVSVNRGLRPVRNKNKKGSSGYRIGHAAVQLQF